MQNLEKKTVNAAISLLESAEYKVLRKTVAEFMANIVAYIHSAKDITQRQKKPLLAMFIKGVPIIEQSQVYPAFYQAVQEQLGCESSEPLLELSLLALPIATAAQNGCELAQALSTDAFDERSVQCIHWHIDQVCTALQVLALNSQTLKKDQRPISQNSTLRAIFASGNLLTIFIDYWKQQKGEIVVAPDSETTRPAVSQSPECGTKQAEIKVPDYESLVNKVNSNGDTLLIIAAKTGNATVAATCLMLGGDPNHCNKAGYSAIAYALDKPDVLRQLFIYMPKLKERKFEHKLYEKYESKRLSVWREKTKNVSFLSDLIQRWPLPRQADTKWKLWQLFFNNERNALECGLDNLKAYQMLQALLDIKKRKELLQNIENAGVNADRAELAYKRLLNDFLLVNASSGDSQVAAIYGKYHGCYDDLKQLTEVCQPFSDFICRVITAKENKVNSVVQTEEQADSFEELLRKHLAKTTDLIVVLEEVTNVLYHNRQAPLAPHMREGYEMRETISALAKAAQSKLEATKTPPPIDTERLTTFSDLLLQLTSKNMLVLNAYLNYLVGLHLNASMPHQFNLHGMMGDNLELLTEDLHAEQRTEATGTIIIKLFIGTFDRLSALHYDKFLTLFKALILCNKSGDEFDSAYSSIDTFLHAIQQGGAEVSEVLEAWKINKIFVQRFRDLEPSADKRWQELTNSPSVVNHHILKQKTLHDVLMTGRGAATKNLSVPVSVATAAAIGIGNK